MLAGEATPAALDEAIKNRRFPAGRATATRARPARLRAPPRRRRIRPCHDARIAGVKRTSTVAVERVAVTSAGAPYETVLGGPLGRWITARSGRAAPQARP